jgi:hypothetical protein
MPTLATAVTCYRAQWLTIVEEKVCSTEVLGHMWTCFGVLEISRVGSGILIIVFLR